MVEVRVREGVALPACLTVCLLSYLSSLLLPLHLHPLAARKKKGSTANFSWVFNREVQLH